jgi:hypothetical protein
MHYPREEVPVWLLQAQDIEPALVGVIYTLKKQTLRRIQGKCAASPVPSLPAVAWNLNIVPCVPRDIFSVAVQSARGHTRRNSVIECGGQYGLCKCMCGPPVWKAGWWIVTLRISSSLAFHSSFLGIELTFASVGGNFGKKIYVIAAVISIRADFKTVI